MHPGHGEMPRWSRRSPICTSGSTAPQIVLDLKDRRSDLPWPAVADHRGTAGLTAARLERRAAADTLQGGRAARCGRDLWFQPAAGDSGVPEGARDRL